jgi:hypothetical protein
MGKMNEMEKEFKVMDWPGNFNDLSTIENCWGYVKSELKNYRAVTSLPKLIWVQDMPIDYFRKLSNSMPSRIEKVLANRAHEVLMCSTYVPIYEHYCPLQHHSQKQMSIPLRVDMVYL